MANPVRSILPLLAVLLLMAALASAATAQSSGPVTQASSSAPPDWLVPTCTKNASRVAPTLPSPPQWKSPVCGSCSGAGCRGVTEFTLCNVGFGTARCLVVDTCSDNTPLCTCGGG